MLYNRSRSVVTVLLPLSLLVIGCSDASESTTSDAPSTDASTPATEPGASTTTEAIRASVSTLPADPSVFDPNSIGDPLELASFVFTREEAHSANGQQSARTTAMGYIKEPNSVYVVTSFHDGTGMTEYFVNGRTYQVDNQNFWYLYENGSPAAPSLINELRGSQAMYGVMTATFVGPEDYLGVPAYHYTFDETNLQNYASYTPDNPSPEAEGDFFLAQDGNYVLYAHVRQVAAGTGFELIDEFTEAMSSVNALTEITLPAELLPLKQALDEGSTFGIPMLPDAAVDSMVNYNEGGIGVYYYQYTTTWKNETEFLDFYRSLQPTNGWTVTHIGAVKNLDAFCSDGNCVMIKNGDKQFILYFDGSNLHADYDREHRFVAQ